MTALVALGETGVLTSRLGFGCSALLGPKSRQESEALLEAAFDAGITHFDVARAYGSGDAEHVVGSFLRRHRDETTVTTKFGIAPPTGAAGNHALRAIARRAMRMSPQLRRALGRQGARMTTTSQFSPAFAKTSIETSLGALGVERIDVLLLHEPSPDDCTEELLELLEALRAAGTIRSFGVGADRANALAIAQRSPPQFARVVQMPSDFERCTLRAVARAAPTAGTITHGTLIPAPRLLAALANDRVLAERWRSELDADVTDMRVLGRLLLAHAIDVNRRGPVIFRTVQIQRIAGNAQAVTEDPQRLRCFAALLSELAAARPVGSAV